MRRGAAILVVAVLGLVPVARGASQQEVEEALTCQCGCGLTVHACNHLQCSSGEPIKKEIAERLGRGEDTDTILTAFKQRYGEKVLSSPTFRGFNWFAWITPFAAVLLRALALTRGLRRAAQATAPARATPAASAATDRLRAQLARELDELDRD